MKENVFSCKGSVVYTYRNIYILYYAVFSAGKVPWLRSITIATVQDYIESCPLLMYLLMLTD